MNISRRGFLSTSTGIISCTAMGIGLQSCGIGSLLYSSNDIPISESLPIIHLEQEPLLQKINGAVKKRFAGLNNGDVVIIVRTSEKHFTAFAAQCTHWGAEIHFPEKGVFHCPFHGSQFSTENGTVIEGPAEVSLHQYKIVVDEIAQELKLEENDR